MTPFTSEHLQQPELDMYYREIDLAAQEVVKTLSPFLQDTGVTKRMTEEFISYFGRTKEYEEHDFPSFLTPEQHEEVKSLLDSSLILENYKRQIASRRPSASTD